MCPFCFAYTREKEEGKYFFLSLSSTRLSLCVVFWARIVWVISIFLAQPQAKNFQMKMQLFLLTKGLGRRWRSKHLLNCFIVELARGNASLL